MQLPPRPLSRTPKPIAAYVITVFIFLAGFFGLRAANAVITFTDTPNVVSNTYNGLITLQINGLTNGVTNVVVQKFLDVNSNGIIDSKDLLVQQFPLAVGVASVFTNLATSTPVTVTNFLPGDMVPAGSQIVAPLNFQNGDFAQTLAARYLYKISSPSGQFLPVTNSFIVTNSFSSSWVTGAVQNAVSSTNIPNAIVLLCVNQSGGLVVQAGTVADTNGNFSIPAPPGNYFLAGIKTNFVDDISQSGITLSANQTNTVSVNLTPAWTNVPGKVVDAASPATGLPGLSGLLISSNDLFSFYFTDTNGNFSTPIVGTNLWESQINPLAAAFKGYLSYQYSPFFNITNKGVAFTNALSRAQDIFYGVVSNAQAVPLPGVYLYGNDTNGNQSLALSDQNGNYVLLASTNLWNMSILATNNPGLNFTNDFVFSPGYVQTAITNIGLAIQQNFVIATAFYTISGNVEDIDGNPIDGVQVYAFSTNAPGYQAFSAYTAANGTYSLNVSPDLTWTVGVSSNSLVSLGYTNIPATQNVFVSGTGTGVSGIDFSILICGEIEILTTNLPNATLGAYYQTNLLALSCHNITNWSTAFGINLTPLYQKGTNSFPPGTALYSNSKLVGFTETYFSIGIVIQGGLATPFFTNCTYSDNNGSAGLKVVFNNITANINVSAPIYGTNNIQFGGNGLVWTALPTTQNTTNYTTVLSLPQLSMVVNGQSPQAYTVGSGTLMTGASNTSNTVAKVLGGLSPMIPGNSLNLASSFPYTSSNDAVVWALSKHQTNQYLISANGLQQTNLPPGLVLYPNGLLAGTPTNIFTTNVVVYYPPHPKPRIVTNTVVLGTNGTYTFTVAATDANSDVAVQTLYLTLGSTATTSMISTPSGSQAAAMLLSSNYFPLEISTVLPGQNYTVQMTTNLLSTNWTAIYSTNAVNTNALVIPDPNATDPARFYRILISP